VGVIIPNSGDLSANHKPDSWFAGRPLWDRSMPKHRAKSAGPAARGSILLRPALLLRS